jgi:hypothetical protein
VVGNSGSGTSSINHCKKQSHRLFFAKQTYAAERLAQDPDLLDSELNEDVKVKFGFPFGRKVLSRLRRQALAQQDLCAQRGRDPMSKAKKKTKSATDKTSQQAIRKAGAQQIGLADPDNLFTTSIPASVAASMRTLREYIREEDIVKMELLADGRTRVYRNTVTMDEF